MSKQGWISLHRKILENPTICRDSDYFAIWVYFLLKATHAEYDTEFAGNRITLKPGQCLTGRKSIAAKFSIDESKVQRIIKRFETEQQIEQQTSNRNRLITVLNWSKYQDGEQPKEQQVNNKRTTDEQQMNTNNNVNKTNNEIIKRIGCLFPGTGDVATRKKKLPEISKKYGEEELVLGIERYKSMIATKRLTGFNQAYMGEGKWWNGQYESYLTENYKEPQDESPLSTAVCSLCRNSGLMPNGNYCGCKYGKEKTQDE